MGALDYVGEHIKELRTQYVIAMGRLSVIVENVFPTKSSLGSVRFTYDHDERDRQDL